MLVTAIVMMSQNKKTLSNQNTNAQIGTQISKNTETATQNNAVNSKKTGSIEGGAWLTKGGGQSDLLRGLTIYVLPEVLSVKEMRSVLTALQEKITKKEKENIENANKGDVLADEHKKVAETMTSARNLIDDLLKDSNITIKTVDLYKLVRISQTSVNGIYFMSVMVLFDDEWNEILKEHSVTKSTTGLDAKYIISDINAGSCLVYAKFAGSTEIIEWLIPITVTEGSNKLDLYNDNVRRLYNKKGQNF